MSEVQTEQVLVVPTERFHALGHFQGFSAQTELLQELLDPAHTSYRSRDAVEQDPSFKQLIPYCLFRYTDPEGTVNLFQYTRGSGQGEARLHAKKSVGIGGHIAHSDAGEDRDPYREGMQRELAEEITIDTTYTEACVGLINDDATPVGQVHLGVVHLFDLAAPQVAAREAEICDAGFLPVADIVADLDAFETWSQIGIRALFAPQSS